MSTVNEPSPRFAAAGRPFTSILCAIDVSAAGSEAVRQAAVLAGAGATLETVAFVDVHAPGAPHPVGDQMEALVEAVHVAAAHGVGSELHIEEAPSQAAGMLERCAGHDLLVAPPARATFEALVHAPIPVLLARRPPSDVAFPDGILVAVDGTPAAHDAVRLAARLAASHRTRVAFVASPEHDAAHQQALLDDMAVALDATGALPVVLDEYGPPPERAIVAAARRLEAALIVIGSRPGAPPGSVSAAVARRADCSVLVLRPGRKV